jgi:glutamyl-tRNA reductase
MGRLTPEQEGVVDSLTATLVARLLHHTVIQIEQLTEEGRAEAMAIVRALLGLT